MPVAQSTLASLEKYRDDRLHPGGWLRAILANDLSCAVGSASVDNQSWAVLRDIVAWIYNNVPIVATGSYAAVDDWLNGN